MVHASLRAIGPVEGGADALLDALDRVVGRDGTLLMILGAEIVHDFVNHLPEAERPALLADAPPFDAVTGPVLPEVGYFAEAFRRRPGTLVNDNPSGRFGARGRHAQDLLQDAPWHDYYGPGSPLERFCRMGGRRALDARRLFFPRPRPGDHRRPAAQEGIAGRLHFAGEHACYKRASWKGRSPRA